jgi:hypothetical protein
MLQGERFSPRLAEAKTGVSLQGKKEPGEIGSVGRYRGQPLPYGTAELTQPERAQSSGDQAQNWVLQVLSAHLDEFRACGATDIVLRLLVEYREQCNLELDADFLEAVGKLRLPLTIAFFEAEPGDEESA